MTEQAQDGEVIARIQATGVPSGPPLLTGAGAAINAGRRARHRRRLLVASASGAVLAGAAALAVVLTQAGPVADREVVMAPAAGGGQPAPADLGPRPDGPQRVVDGVDPLAVLAARLGPDFRLVEERSRVELT